MQPILLDIPEQFESEKLLIRVPRPGDGAILQEAYLESYPRLKPWFPWAQNESSVEEREIFVREQYARFIKKEDMMLFLILKNENKLIGCSGLHSQKWDVPSFEIGYWVRTGYEGKGYILEAVNAITKFGFEILKANRIFIRCDIENIRSQSVAKRAGYMYEGTFRNFERRHHTGELTDMTYFALTSDDYEKMKSLFNK
ncbi:MAG: GNAT family N-acetyltransferase [Anaerolineaceae bacterium]|nr:GNAT family N-acetyltransferase [Anaerolineaceae bacterium]